MKSLYESILDDEDVLIKRLKDDVNNPLNLLINTLERGIEGGNINTQEIKSLFQNGTFDNFFEDVLGLDIKHFKINVFSLGPCVRIEFKFGYNYIVDFSYCYWRRNDMHLLLATKRLFDTKYKNTGLERTNLYTNRRRITQNLKKLGFEKAFYSDKNYEHYIYKQN